jgi:hypothetical protein
MKGYAGKHFVKIDDVRDGPIEGTIVDISAGEYEKLNLTLDTGDCLSLNKTNTTRLVRAFGADSDRAIGQMVRLFLGEIKYQGRMQEAVVLEPIKTAQSDSPLNEVKEPSLQQELNDAIPDFGNEKAKELKKRRPPKSNILDAG